MIVTGDWLDGVKRCCMEWQPIDRNVLVSRLRRELPPGYAWQVHLGKNMERLRRRHVAKFGDDEDFKLPEPRGLADADRARTALAEQIVGELLEDGWLVDDEGLIRVK